MNQVPIPRLRWSRLLARAAFGVTLVALVFASGCGKGQPEPAPVAAPAPAAPASSTGPAATSVSGTNAAVTALLPTNVIAFAAVDVHRLWETSEGKGFRQAVEGIEPGSIARMEREMGVNPANVSHLALVMVSLGNQPVTIVLTTTPVNQANVIKSVCGARNVKEVDYQGKKLHVNQPWAKAEPPRSKTPSSKDKIVPPGASKDKGSPPSKQPPAADKSEPDLSGQALVFVNDRAFAVGIERDVRAWLDQIVAPKSGPLSSAVALAKENHDLVAGINPAGIPSKMISDLPPTAKPLLPLTKAKWVTVVGQFGKETHVDLKAEFPDEAAATEGEKAVGLGQSLLALVIPEVNKEFSRDGNPLVAKLMGPLKELESALTSAKPTMEGKTVHVVVDARTDLTLSPQDLVDFRVAADRKRNENNVKQLALSFNNYASTYRDALPPAAICDKDGKPLLSWRVLILPYVEQDALYRQFKLNEPWDSPNNAKLLDQMPNAYRIPGSTEKNKTHYQLLVGPHALYDGTVADAATSAQGGLRDGLRGTFSKYRITNIPDGTARTIFLVEAANAVPWTKPEDVSYDPKKPIPALGKSSPDQFLTAFVAGYVRWVKKTVPEKSLRDAIDPADGNPLAADLDPERNFPGKPMKGLPPARKQ